MAVPIWHPFWRALVVIVPIALASAAFVYFRAEHIAAPTLVSRKGAQWTRRAGSIGTALTATVLGMGVALVYTWLLERFPVSAPSMFSGAGIIGGLCLGALVLVARRGRGLAASWELVLLGLLWGIGYGLLIPAVSRVAT